tara:strand:- start:503 stop:754 length:252 start_codon:yes stop_codon:yes gene_type:complete
MLSQPVSVTGFGGILSVPELFTITGEALFNRIVLPEIIARVWRACPGALMWIFFQFVRTLQAVQLHSAFRWILRFLSDRFKGA